MSLTANDVRKEYERGRLREDEADPDPFAMFDDWYQGAVAGGIREPNAMTLATSTPDGHPSARVVLLKGFDARGFSFFTNYESRKGQELAANPFAALVFWWGDLERQVRIEGTVERLTAAESDEYYESRPLGARLGAWVSAQSRVIPGRAVLEERLAGLQAEYAGHAPHRPPFWGGYRLAPAVIEFWQGGPHRLTRSPALHPAPQWHVGKSNDFHHKSNFGSFTNEYLCYNCAKIGGRFGKRGSPWLLTTHNKRAMLSKAAAIIRQTRTRRRASAWQSACHPIALLRLMPSNAPLMQLTLSPMVAGRLPDPDGGRAWHDAGGPRHESGSGLAVAGRTRPTAAPARRRQALCLLIWHPCPATRCT